MSKISAIVLAAGNGSRMKSETKKQFIELEGMPIVCYSLETFENSQVDEIILVTNSDAIDYCKNEIVEKYNYAKVKDIVAGGSERYESVYNGLKKVTGDIVLIHDGARPLITQDIIDRSIDGVKQHNCCVVGVPVKDTIKIADENRLIEDTPNRNKLWITQTPQSFYTNIVKSAYEAMLENKSGVITDDAMVVEKYSEEKVYFVEGDYANIKVTTPEDIPVAKALLECLKNIK